MPLSAADRALVAAASDLIRQRHLPDWHHLAAAVRTREGKVYRAINVDAYVGRCSTCAEAVAVGMALTDGRRDLDTIVTVRWVGRGRPVVVSPCGICREMLVDYGDPYVIHAEGKRVFKRRASALLPASYGRPGEPRPANSAKGVPLPARGAGNRARQR